MDFAQAFFKVAFDFAGGFTLPKSNPPSTYQKGWEDDFPIGFWCQVCVGEGSCSRSNFIIFLFAKYGSETKMALKN